MRAPDFWSKGRGGVSSALLLPASWLYASARRLCGAMAGQPYSSPVPVICIGNVTAGGAGKTPVAQDLGRRLIARDVAVHFLSRGYGGTMTGPVRVDTNTHGSLDVGDEPLLLAAIAPTWVAKDRAQGARCAIDADAGIIIMDDGFQNPSVTKDLSLLVIDGGFGIGNGRQMPAGPLREPLATALERAYAVVIIGDDVTNVATDLANTNQSNRPILRANISPVQSGDGSAVVAFAGIGRPQKFFDTLDGAGFKISEAAPYPDHHPYTSDDMAFLRDLAERHEARLITTEKDFARLAATDRAEVETLTITLQWEDEAALEGVLNSLLATTS